MYLIKNYFLLFIFSLFLAVSCKNGNTEEKTEKKSKIRIGKEDVTELTAAIERNPKNAALLIERAHLYEQNKQLEPAIRDVESAVNVDTTKADWYLYLADLYSKRPYIKGTLIALEKASELQPNNKEIFLRLGKQFFEIKNREASFKNLNAALKIDPYLADAFYYRGYNYREMKFPDKAIENFEKAIEIAPDYFEAYLQLGLLYAEKNSPRAEAYYSSALRLKEQNKRALYARGMYYQSVDSTKKAIQDYLNIVKQEPMHRAANYNLGFNYYLLQDYENALNYFTKATEADPDYAEAYFGKSNSEKKLGMIKEAQADEMKFEELRKEGK